MSADGLRLVSWNCFEGFQEKWPKLVAKLEPDVAVVTECCSLPPAPETTEAREVTEVVSRVAEGNRKHIGVFARAPWKAVRVQHRPELPWLVHAHITDTLGRFGSFDVLAVWALGREYVPNGGYARQTTAVIKEVLEQLPPHRHVVVAGDLNTPVASNKSDTRVHAANVGRLCELDLLSAFTAHCPDKAPLDQPTFYAQWKKTKPFHIDHVFVPFGWCDRQGFEMSVGSFDEWVGARLSDHVPLLVKVPPPTAPRRTPWVHRLPVPHDRLPQTRGVGAPELSEPEA